MTRAEINAKYGIVRLMPPNVANKELSAEEAEKYEKMILISVRAFDEYFDEDFSDDID